MPSVATIVRGIARFPRNVAARAGVPSGNCASISRSRGSENAPAYSSHVAGFSACSTRRTRRSASCVRHAPARRSSTAAAAARSRAMGTRTCISNEFPHR